MTYPCPVCAFELSRAPWDESGRPAFDVCPSCGTAFGAEDVDATGTLNRSAYRVLRDQWIAAGMPWHSQTVPMPTEWPADRDMHFPGRGSLIALPVAVFSDLGFPSNFTVLVRSGGWFDIQPGGSTVHLTPGGTSFTGAAATPLPDVALLISAGDCWLLDCGSGTQTSVAQMAYGVWGLPRIGLLLINNHDHLVAIDASGSVVWVTDTLSMCSDFRHVRVDGTLLSGEAEGPHEWHPFSVELTTGASKGGWNWVSPGEDWRPAVRSRGQLS